jgi:hypothetical protein
VPFPSDLPLGCRKLSVVNETVLESESILPRRKFNVPIRSRGRILRDH